VPRALSNDSQQAPPESAVTLASSGRIPSARLFWGATPGSRQVAATFFEFRLRHHHLWVGEGYAEVRGCLCTGGNPAQLGCSARPSAGLGYRDPARGRGWGSALPAHRGAGRTLGGSGTALC
jgi:hypothetical protein